MDLKSMLNDSAGQRPPPPRLHTSNSSLSDRPYDSRASHDAGSDRPTPLATSGYAADGRPSGNYFGLQSPIQHNSASTPSAGAPSAYAQSPGPVGPIYTPRRESMTPQHILTPGYVPPPSPIAAHPQTPGAQYYPGQPAPYPQAYTPQSAMHQRPPTRDEYPHTNGRLQHQPSFHMSPPPPHPQQTPSTPLGPPPTNYPRPSIHSQRPPSQGYDHLRRASVGSMGSNHSREPSMAQTLHHDGRAGSLQRTYSGDEERLRQERERSDESVSPKTIPRPPPHRTNSNFSHPYEQSPVGSVASHSSAVNAQIVENHTPVAMQSLYHQSPMQAPDQRSQPFSRPSPGARPQASMTPKSTNSSLPPQPSPPSAKPPSKKRSASVISTAPAAMPPQKRIKREEKPVWAQCARQRRLFLGNNPRSRRARKDNGDTRDIKQEVSPFKTDMAIQNIPSEEKGLSILNTKPRNDLVFTVCEWVHKQLTTKAKPPDSIFEIEAKLGVIWDIKNESRLHLPVRSEAVFDREAWPSLKTKFDTSVMSPQAHEELNTFLNKTVVYNKHQVAAGKLRYPMEYVHTQEWDEYHDLNNEGQGHLPHLTHWHNSKHQMKVRRTFDKKTGEMKAQIIKTRVADLDIYNPNDAFDYRISISLETPWHGSDSHLVPDRRGAANAGNDRLKNRLSYKHHDYQIDLTQIEHTNGSHPDHEIEIEIMNESILDALEAVRDGHDERYERLLSGFLDNIRILAGHASKAVRPPQPGQQQMGMMQGR